MPYKDPDKRRECVQRYYQAHRQEILAYHRDYYHRSKARRPPQETKDQEETK